MESTDTNSKMTFKSISIKSFISDLPNVFNVNFLKLADFINSVFDFAHKKLHNISDIEVTGTVTANTVKAKNLIIKGGINTSSLVITTKDAQGNPVTVDLMDVYNQLNNLEKYVARYVRRNAINH